MPLNTDALGGNGSNQLNQSGHVNGPANGRDEGEGGNPNLLPMNPMAQMQAAIMNNADQNNLLRQQMDQMTAMFGAFMARMGPATPGPAPNILGGPPAQATAATSTPGGALPQPQPPGIQVTPPPAAIQQLPQQLSTGVHNQPPTGLQQQPSQTPIGQWLQQHTLGTPSQMQQQQVAAAGIQIVAPPVPQPGLQDSTAPERQYLK